MSTEIAFPMLARKCTLWIRHSYTGSREGLYGRPTLDDDGEQLCYEVGQEYEDLIHNELEKRFGTPQYIYGGDIASGQTMDLMLRPSAVHTDTRFMQDLDFRRWNPEWFENMRALKMSYWQMILNVTEHPEIIGVERFERAMANMDGAFKSEKYPDLRIIVGVDPAISLYLKTQNIPVLGLWGLKACQSYFIFSDEHSRITKFVRYTPSATTPKSTHAIDENPDENLSAMRSVQ